MALKMMKRAGQLILIPAACCLLVLLLMALVNVLRGLFMPWEKVEKGSRK